MQHLPYADGAAVPGEADGTPGEVEDAMKSTACKYTHGAPYVAAGAYTTSYDKGTGLVDVVAAAQKLGATATTTSLVKLGL